jgi:redox-sensitive bicupin YhaK (pirin superfamily)
MKVMSKKIAAVIPMPYHAFDANSGANMLRADLSLLDPFIGVDSYTMPYSVFGPHPHAGMSAVSLMLPEADGGFINRDSLGDHSDIRPGDLHWTQAGRGMMHEEIPSEPGKAARGMQIFVNLARQNKQAEPIAFKVKHEDMPRVAFAGASVRVVTGALGDVRSPIADDTRWLTTVNLFDVTIEAGASIALPVAAGDTAFFVIRSGAVALPSGDGVSQSAIVFDREVTAGIASFSATNDAPVRGVFFSGAPIGEPVVQGGPFTGNNAEDITHYKRAFAQGLMGRLAPTF